MNELDRATLESAELIEATFNFWYSDAEHIRSPFPDYIRTELRLLATDRFFDWAESLREEAKNDLNDEAVGEKFEEVIFETALGLVKTEDEKITILYPFLPRIGDELADAAGVKNKIVDREIQVENEETYLKVKCKSIDGDKLWETRFNLPV